MSEDEAKSSEAVRSPVLPLTQRVHVGIWYILRAQRGSHIPTLRRKYIPYSYMDPLGEFYHVCRECAVYCQMQVPSSVLTSRIHTCCLTASKLLLTACSEMLFIALRRREGGGSNAATCTAEAGHQ